MHWIRPQSRFILTLTAREKNGKQAIGKTRGGWNTKINAVTSGDTQVIGFILSAGNVLDAQAGRLLLEILGKQENTVVLLMDRAYQDDVKRLTAWGIKFNPVVPPKRNRIKPWGYEKE
jgi:transposase-like protein